MKKTSLSITRIKTSLVARRNICRAVLVGTSAVFLTGFGLKLPGLGGGGGGGGGFAGAIKSFAEAMREFAKGSILLGIMQADLADALGLKEEADLMRGQAKLLEDKGEDVEGSDLKEFGTNSETVGKAINAKMEAAENLTDKQKEDIAKAAAKTPVVFGHLFKGIIKILAAKQAASSGGTPSLGDMEALKMVGELPKTIPYAVSFLPNAFSTIQKFNELAEEKDITVPDTDDMELPAGVG